MIKELLVAGKPLPWIKRGLILGPNIPGFSHASHPCAVCYDGDVHILAFTCRDRRQRSHVFLCYARLDKGNIELIGKPKLALKPGDPGHFDCDGVISASFVTHENKHLLYYVGWQNHPNGLWSCDTGRATLSPYNLSLERDFLGPVLGRDKYNPLFAAGTAFYVDQNLWQAWYNSGLTWEERDGVFHHKYSIHYASSHNGTDWLTDYGQCIPFRDDYEYAFGRPTVYVEDTWYFMWYACRATEHADKYRLGFAFSKDGVNWERRDKQVGLDVSTKGWDSEMICYPYVFSHKGIIYMLYNGNSYGKTGFGLAHLGKAV